MEFNPITCVSQNEAHKIIALRGRKGLFWTLENGRYIGIDNRESLPPRGAWIEISPPAPKTRPKEVAPPAGSVD